jgi:peptidoglycan/xylan/chitin deacetylase (PgdA/CDA1 family)
MAQENTAPPSRPARAGSTSATPQHVFRRRRAAAAALCVGSVALLAAALSSHGGHTNTPAGAHVRHLRRPPRSVAALTPTLARENRAIDEVRSYAATVVSGGGRGGEVALTFDDGPGPYTQRLVAQLDALHVRATFFTVGSQEQYFPAGTAAELASGDAVEDHSETHPMMATLSAHDQYEQLFEPVARIEIAGGPHPRLFRPPYGSFDATTLRELRRLHMLMVLWSVDTGDYARPGVEAIVQRALAGAVPGAIILMHDAGGDRTQTIAALPAIVAGLRKRGLRPVTVPRLLLDDPPPRGQRIPGSLAGG